MQGDPAKGLHVVVHGRVKVFKSSPQGRAQTLMIMGPGEPVGEVAALAGEPYPATRGDPGSPQRPSTSPGMPSST